MSMMSPRWDPWTELASLHSTMDRIFGDAFGGTDDEERQPARRAVYLPLNIVERRDAYELEAPVPGMTPEEIEVTFVDGLLTIRARHAEEVAAENQGRVVRREFFRGDHVRQLALPGEIDGESIEAQVENGLLTVRVPKAPTAQPRRIQVGSGEAGRARLVGSD